MDSRKAVILTGRVVAGATVALLGWEGYTLINSAPGDTISETIWAATYATPLVPFTAGILCGHWFFPKSRCVNCGKRPWAKEA